VSQQDDVPPILVLVRDLMFSGRISAEARAAGVAVKMLRNPADLAQFAEAKSRTLIVDLNLADAIPAAASWRRAPDRLVVGFVSHMDAQAITMAREAGIDQVLARSQFVKILPNILRGEPVS
jgi:hypothetical protein